MIHLPRSRFLPASRVERHAGPISFGLMVLWLAISGAPARAEIDCGTGRLELTPEGSDRRRGGYTVRSDFFTQVCNAYMDTEHFRLHYSTQPGSVANGTAMDVAVSGERALVAAGASGLQFVDIHVPGAPAVVDSLPVPGSVQRVVATDDLAAVLAGNDLHLVRTGNPPALAGRIAFPSAPRGLAIQGSMVFVTTGSGLQIVDVSHPETPVQIATLFLPGDPREVAVAGNQIAVAVGDPGVAIVDGSDPAHPIIAAIVDTPASATGVAIEGELVYVADGPGGLVILYRFDIQGWKIVGGLSAVGAVSRVIVRDHQAYVTRLGGRVLLVDCTFDTSPRLSDQEAFFGEVTGFALDGKHAYAAVAGYGLQVVSTLTTYGTPWLRQLQDQLRGWPSTALCDSMAVAFERAYDVFQGMGFRMPLGDGDLGGGRDLIDCYIYNLPEQGGDAYAHPEEPVAGACDWSYYGHLGADNQAAFSSNNRTKDVAAHELFHLIQYAYDMYEDDWFQESTAVWSEEHVRPSQTLVGDTRCWFRAPYLTLWERFPDCRMYGSVHFWLFQEQTTDATIVRRCLERSCPEEDDWLAALKAELAARGLDFNRQLAEFARWNYCTGERADARHYRLTLPEVDLQAEHAHFPVTDGSVDPVAGPAGTNYVRFVGPGRQDTLRITFRSDPRLVEWREVTLVATQAPNRHREWILDLDKEGRASAVIPDWPSYDSACLIVANGDSSESGIGPADYAFSYAAFETGPAPITRVAQHPVPNPTATETTISWRLAEESAHLKLDIYDLSGRLVRRLADQTFARGDHELTWDGRTEDDRRAPSGVYFYRLELQGSSYRGRLILVR